MSEQISNNKRITRIYFRNMIKSKESLCYFLEEDRKAYSKPIKKSLKERLITAVFPDYNYEFMICIRKLDYWSEQVSNRTNLSRIYSKIICYYYQIKKQKLRIKTGIELSEGCAGPGLHIAHGKIVVHHKAEIGSNCKIMSDVTIGINGRKDVPGIPVIGNRVFIGSGARIIGPITIADDVVIGANAVVTHSITEKGITVAGNPARKISDRSSADYYLSAII